MQAYRISFQPLCDGPSSHRDGLLPTGTGRPRPASIVVLSDEPAFRGLTPGLLADVERTLLRRYYPETATGIEVLGVEPLGEAVVLEGKWAGVVREVVKEMRGDGFRHPAEAVDGMVKGVEVWDEPG